MRSENSLIDIIIPVFDDLGGLEKTVASLKSQTYPSQHFNLIVANDGAGPQIRQFCDAEQIECVEISPNRGSYNARNQAILASQAQYLGFLDAGVIATSEWLFHGVKMLEQYDYVAGDVRISTELVRDIATFHDSLLAFPIQLYLDKFHFGVTANLFVRREVFNALGLFDSELRSGGDLEFGERVFRSGKFSQLFCSDCVVYHPPRNHEEKLQKAIRVDKGQQILRNKYPERFGKLNAKSNLLTFFGRFLPPSPVKVKRLYKPSDDYSFLSFYLYSARLKYLLHKQKTKLKS